MINLPILAKAYDLNIFFCIGLLTYPKIKHNCPIAPALNSLIKKKENEFMENQIITPQKRESLYFHGVVQWGIKNESISYEEFNKLCDALERPDNINITLESAARVYSTFIAKQLTFWILIERKSAIYVLENDGCTLKKEVLGISRRFVDGVLSECSRDAPRTRRPRGEISASDAAKAMGVSSRTIQNWDRGKNSPPGYPGRSNAISFYQFANTWKNQKAMNKIVRSMNNPVSGGGIADKAADKTSLARWEDRDE